MAILIGSNALWINFNPEEQKQYRRFKRKELDLIVSEWEINFLKEKFPSIKESSKFHGHYTLTHRDYVYDIDATQSESNKLMNRFFLKPISANFPELGLMHFVPDLEILYMIKRSHANFDIHFDKTMFDINFLQKIGVTDYRNDVDFYLFRDVVDFYLTRKREASERYKLKSKVNLNKSNEDFFKGGANLRKYDHDSLHQIVAFYDKPLFMKCKYDLNSAKIERVLFDELSDLDQIRMAQEEAMVIGLERYYIPGLNNNLAMVYRLGLLKLIKDLSKGWFQDFMIDNFHQILKTNEVDFIQKFNNTIGEMK